MNTVVDKGFRSLNRTKIGEQISLQLLEKIISGEYPAGTRLPSERDIAVLTGASRVAVREGIGSLVAKGILSVKQGAGTVVNPMDEWNTLDPQVLLMLHGEEAIEHLMEFRYMFEPELAAIAAKRISDEEVEKLIQYSDLPDEDTIEQHVVRDTAFHILLAKITGNSVMLLVMTSIEELMEVNRRKAFIVPGEVAKARHWHQEVAHAIAARDPQRAKQAMRDHMKQVINALSVSVETSE